MDLFLQQLLSGIAIGGVYALVALAVVMIYQASDHFNFAQGEMAMFSTYIAWSLIDLGLPYWLAFLLTLALSFVGAVALERIVVRPVERAPVLNQVIVFIGLLVIFNALAGWLFDYTIKPFPSPFPEQPLFGNPYIGSHELGVIGVTLIGCSRWCSPSCGSRRSGSPCAPRRRTRIRPGWSAFGSAGCWRSAGGSPPRSARSPA